MNQLEAMAARLRAATPGEWRLEDTGPAGRGFSWRVVCEGRVLAQMRVYPGNGDDGLLMVYAPADLAALLAVARAGGALTDPSYPMGDGRRCVYCGQDWLDEGHHSECPWLEFQAALAPLLKEVEP